MTPRKKLVGLFVMAGALMLLAAWAGDAGAAVGAYVPYHKGATLNCNDCHSVHGGVAAAANPPFRSWVGTTYAKLLKAQDGCTSCHEGQSTAPDVVGSTNSASGNVNVRSAGFVTTADDQHGHQPTVGATAGSARNAPGGGFTAGELKCTSCHDQHGSATGTTAFRNLVSGSVVVKATMAASQGDVTDTTVDVFMNAAAGAPTNGFPNGDRYMSSNVGYLNKDGDNTYAKWSNTCHTGFESSTGPYTKHPTGVNVGTGNSSATQYTNLNSGSRVRVAYKDGSNQYNVTCVSCHRAHGSGQSYGLMLYTYSTSAANTDQESGDASSSQVLCNQCHTQGF